jgi:hypothetical protein
MYQMIGQPKPTVDRRFEIEFLAGMEVFSFTFGECSVRNQLRRLATVSGSAATSLLAGKCQRTF